VNGRRFLAATVAQLKMTFRNRIALFWALAFPIIFMTLLGILFGGSTSGGTLTIVDQARTPAARALVHALERNPGIEAKTDTSDPAAARKDVVDGDRDALLVLSSGSAGTQARLFYSNASAEQAGIIRGIVAGAADAVSIRASGRPPAIAYRQQSVDSTALDYVDFLLPGIIAIAIMTSSVFGLSTILVDWRKRGILRRLKLTPMPLAEFFGSRIAASLAVTVLQVAVLLVFGRIAFGIHISATAWAAVPVALAGSLAFLAFGFLVGSLVGSPETADAVANSVTTPMMFLSGTFFPVSSLPTALGVVAKALPLYYLSEGLRETTVRGLSIAHAAPDVIVLIGVTLILAVLSLRTFRWEPETA
jgi:ABC-type multidrug transport system permease subunit